MSQTHILIVSDMADAHAQTLVHFLETQLSARKVAVASYTKLNEAQAWLAAHPTSTVLVVITPTTQLTSNFLAILSNIIITPIKHLTIVPANIEDIKVLSSLPAMLTGEVYKVDPHSVDSIYHLADWLGLDTMAEAIDLLTDEEITKEIKPPPLKPAPAVPPAPVLPQPFPSQGRSSTRSQGSDRSAAPPPTQELRFTGYYPSLIAPQQTYSLLCFAHLAIALAEVQRIADNFKATLGPQPVNVTEISRHPVDVGSLLTFVPAITGVTFTPSDITLAWQPPLQLARFVFTAPAEVTTLTGGVHVYLGPLIIGELPITMTILREVTAPQQQSTTFHKYDPIFASYSHKDTPVMEYFRQNLARLGQRMLVDVYDLRAGEHWPDRLLQMIDEAAVFQLFWSEFSKESIYCRKEWEHARQLMATRPRFIQPVYWQEPLPTPPPELADLHFQRIPLPTLTRVELWLSRLKLIFNRLLGRVK